ncbi:response regulator transcription factor [Frankia sp. AgB1.9]|uniref:response regulator transcription factor n=1 Tax=unclassified Frankia TaxID=2632575 RepID=UPI001933C41E|nr:MULTISPECIES: response regulator transcription factor [unclassified Frankia]MBL7488144.1 response regulator transcription factor [Frankia sp. AgW1.1]MBL7552856.1 response regulator transcription factor [Frankia sp. AgB1.9]MBL7620147.1 response regulator transcription factor [Frankia sp. AgB1.8]
MDRVAVGRVFIVDDTAPFRTVARELLERGGYQVVGEATTGDEALAAVPAIGPDIVLLDIALPDLDGFSVCRALHRSAPDVTVVLCSVREAEHYGDAIAASSAAGFLPKSTLSAAALALVVAGRAERR